MNDTPDSRRLDEDLDDIARLLQKMDPPESVSPDRESRARAAAHREWKRLVQRQRRRRSLSYLALAATLATGIGVAASWGLFGDPTPLLARWLEARTPSASSLAVAETLSGTVELHAGGRMTSTSMAVQSSLTQGSSVVTGFDGRAALRLAEGESLRLDHRTRVRMLSVGVLELMEGALYVDSDGRSPEQSLEIRTPFGIVRDIGTQFELRLLADRLVMSVREGRLELDRSNSAVTAIAGERVAVDGEGPVARSTVSTFDESWAWSQSISPPYQLEGKTLEHYLTTVIRETGWHLELDSARLRTSAAEIVLHGDLGDLGIAQALGSVLETCGLVHTLVDGVLHIREADAAGTVEPPNPAVT